MKDRYFFVVLAAALAVCGCAPSASEPSAPVSSSSARATVAPAAPRKEASTPSPAASVQAVIDALNDNQPDRVWEALPVRYQKDVSALVHDFGRRMDGELWAHVFSTIRGITDLAENKKEFILAHPALSDSEQIDTQDLAEHWSDILGTVRTVLDSDIAALKQVETLDVESYLRTTGREALGRLATFTENRFAGARAETVSQTGTSAVVRITFPTPEDAARVDAVLKGLGGKTESSESGASREVALTLVDGKWVPRGVASGWDATIAAAKGRIEAMTPDFFDFFNRQWLPMLDSVDRVMAKVGKTETQEKFNAVVDKQVMPPVTSLLAWIFPGRFTPPVFPAAAVEPSAGAEPASSERGAEKTNASSEGKVVTIVFTATLDEGSEADVSRALMSVVDDPNLGLAVPAETGDGRTKIDVSPVRDVEAFADKIDFGEVVKVDRQRRTITVKPALRANGGSGASGAGESPGAKP